MIQMLKRHPQREEGFTLVELLVVIVILGILAAIVVFAVGGITGTAKTSSQKTDASTVIAAEEAYNAQNGTTTTSYTNTAGLVAAGLLKSAALGYDTLCLSSAAPATSYAVIAEATPGTTNVPACSSPTATPGS
jgi:general secretion pathway protein G